MAMAVFRKGREKSRDERVRVNSNNNAPAVVPSEPLKVSTTRQFTLSSASTRKKRPGQRQRENSRPESFSPQYDGSATFPNFPPTHPSSASNSRHPSFHESIHYPPSPRPRTADAATFELARSKSKTDLASQPPLQPWVDKPLPLLVDNDPRAVRTLAYGDMMTDANGRFVPSIPRPRTSSGIEGQSQRRTRTDILPGSTRPPYTLVPPISTNFDTRFSHVGYSPISRHSSRENTPNGTPTSRKQPPIRNSILDEVETSLTTALRDFQGLQEFIHHDSPPVTPDQLFGPPSFHQGNIEANGFGARRGSSTSLHPGDSYFAQQIPPPNWDTSMAATVAQQQQAFVNGNGTISNPNTPLRTVPPPNAFSGEFTDYDAKLLSIQHAFEEQRKVAHALQMENNSVKQRVNFLHTQLQKIESEKAVLGKKTTDMQEKLSIALERLRQGKSSEVQIKNDYDAAKNRISVLEKQREEEIGKSKHLKDKLITTEEIVEKISAKLEEANTHKVDLIERELENRQEIVVTKKKLKKAVEELRTNQRKERAESARKAEEDDKQKKLLEETQRQLEEARRHNTILEDELRRLSPLSDLPARVSEMAFRIQALESEVVARDTTIASLKDANSRSSSDSLIPPSSEVSSSSSSSLVSAARNEVEDMRRMIEVMDRARKDVVAERDKLAQLLLADMRRVAIEENDRRHPAERALREKPDFETAVSLVRERAKAYVKNNSVEDANGVNGMQDDLQVKVCDLEKEIEYYLNDLVLYRMDVKGYKKDLKRAERRLKELNGGIPITSSRSDSRSPAAAARNSPIGVL